MLAKNLELCLDPAAIMERAGMPPDPWQVRLLRSKAERTLLLCSRQSGKSTVTAAMALHEVLFHPKSLVLLLSPSLRQSQELFRKVTDFRNRLGEPIPVAEESALRVELKNGSRIVALPGTEETVRGFSGVRLLVVDEAARVDDPLYYAIRPMLAVSGGRMVCLTTPCGKRGFFYNEWTGVGSWDRVKVTASECPRISEKFLAEERTSLGERWFLQEFCCSFEENEGGVFAYADIEAALDESITPLFTEPLFGRVRQ
jgi:Terminase large subunit, T4likevirus-type, N-terminal